MAKSSHLLSTSYVKFFILLAGEPILVSALKSIQLLLVFRVVNLPEFSLFSISHHLGMDG